MSDVVLGCEAAVRSTGRAYEIVCVNDGSRDGTAARLARLASEHRTVRVITHPTNLGQAAALWTGLRAARGEIIVTMDGDGQNAPEDIPHLLSRLDGCDMVIGIRANRRDTATRRLISRTANAIRSRLLGDGVRDAGCALRVFKREVMSSFLPIRTLYSYIPSFAANRGFTIRQVEVNHRPRSGGRSSYGLWSFGLKPIADMLALWWLFRRQVPRRR